MVDGDGDAVPNADVSVRGTPLDPVRTDADGAFTIADVPEGQYGIAVTPNACFSPTSVPLTVGAENERLEIPVGLIVDGGGYSCAVSEGEHLRGTDPVAFAAAFVWATVKLPFPIALYNGSHDTLGIGLRGVISPDGSTGPGYGGAGAFPFSAETPVEFAPGGGVFTAATKLDGEDAFVVEYRDARIWAYPIRSEYTEPVDFSATFTRSGKIVFGYGDGIGTDDPVTAGARAITGIQGWAGVDGIRFSDNAPVLEDGMIVTYDLPDWGYLDATVVDKNDGLPVSGATVSFTDEDGLVERVTTGGTGVVHRQLPVADYTMTVEAPNYVTGSYDFTLDELYAKAKIDARLTTGVADLKADGLDVLMGTDQNGVGSLTLTNTGSAPLTYDLAEAERHPELDAAGATTRTGTGADSTIDLTAWTAGASDMTPSNVDGEVEASAAAEADAALKVGATAGGEVITRIEIPGTIEEKEPSGLGYDGDVWVHDYDKRTNTAYTVTGRSTGKVFDASWNPDVPGVRHGARHRDRRHVPDGGQPCQLHPLLRPGDGRGDPADQGRLVHAAADRARLQPRGGRVLRRRPEQRHDRDGRGHVPRRRGRTAVVLRPAAAGDHGPGLQPGVGHHLVHRPDLEPAHPPAAGRPRRLLARQRVVVPGDEAGRGRRPRDRLDRRAVGGGPADRRGPARRRRGRPDHRPALAVALLQRRHPRPGRVDHGQGLDLLEGRRPRHSGGERHRAVRLRAAVEDLRPGDAHDHHVPGRRSMPAGRRSPMPPASPGRPTRRPAKARGATRARTR